MAPPSTHYGPFAVTRPLARAPGAHFLEGRDPEGTPVILQIVHLRAPGAEDTASLRAFVRMVERATEHLGADPKTALIAHGSVDQDDGTTSLYWTVPWIAGAERLGLTTAPVPSVEALGDLATALLARAAARHAVGRLDPLLSPETVLFDAQGAPDVVGFPIHLPKTWRSADVRPAPLAPEEEAIDEPRRSGDLWRVGRILEVAGSRFSDVPSGLQRCIARLSADTPTERYSSAESALRDVEAASTGTVRALPAEPPWLEDDEDRHEAARDLRVPGVLDLFDETTNWDDKPGPWADDSTGTEPPASSSEDVTLAVVPVEDTFRRPVPGTEAAAPPRPRLQEPSVDEDRPARDARPPPNPPPHLSTAPRPRRSGAMWEAASRRSAGPPNDGSPEGSPERAGPADAPVLAEFPSAAPDESDSLAAIRGRPVPEPDVRALARYRPDAEARDSTLESRTKDRSRPDSLYGMVPPARELVDDEASNPAESAEIAPEGVEVQAPEDRRAEVAPAPQAPLFPVSAPPSQAGLRPPPRAAIHPLALAVAFTSGIVVAAAFLLFMDPPRAGSTVSGRRGELEPQIALVTPAYEVLLQASPRNAIVLSETTGRILGTPPIRFLVPQGTAHAVFIAASGHEPQRMVLPLRGRVRTDLVPLAKDLPPCQLRLTTLEGVRLEAVAAPVQFGPLTSVFGAAVVRSNRGDGAWLVRCPRLGGSRRQLLAPHGRAPTARLEVSGPQDAKIIVDNQPPEPAPLERVVPTGFRKLQVAQGGAKAIRFVPVFTETTVRMPKPRPR